MIDFNRFFENRILDSLVDDTKTRLSKRGKIVQKETKEVPYTLDCFRGFDLNIDALKQTGGNYVLSPQKSEQGAMWFTHKFIRGYDPIEYVSGRGEYILTYPLKCKKIFDVIRYEDGSSEERSSEEILNKVETTENCPFACYGNFCLELPHGWFFSYKSEKFIICTVELHISPTMLKKDESNHQEE